MHRRAILGLLSFAMFVAPVAAKEPAPGPAAKGLVVHEWGVFRVNDDAEFANANIRAEWDDLPGFVYGHVPPSPC